MIAFGFQNSSLHVRQRDLPPPPPRLQHFQSATGEEAAFGCDSVRESIPAANHQFSVPIFSPLHAALRKYLVSRSAADQHPWIYWTSMPAKGSALVVGLVENLRLLTIHTASTEYARTRSYTARQPFLAAQRSQMVRAGALRSDRRRTADQGRVSKSLLARTPDLCFPPGCHATSYLSCMTLFVTPTVQNATSNPLHALCP